jgi:D-alanyl-D-alanine carboxypeptidase
MKKRVAIILTVIIAALFSFPIYAYEQDEPFALSSLSVLVMDAYTGRVLHEIGGFTRRYPASITKVMTALLVLENAHPDDIIIFSETAVDLPYYASNIGIEEGEMMTVRHALKAIMLPSANEVARALAEHISGTQQEFVELMNRRAELLGAYETRFANPCGLPAFNQFTTAFDISLIMREAMAHELFREIIAMPSFEHGDREILNTNRMVRPGDVYQNRYITGGKTGFTFAAQRTLVSHATRGEYSFIIAVLHSPVPGGTFRDTTWLLEHVYDMLTYVPAPGDEPEQPEATPEEEEDEDEAVFVFAPVYYFPEPEPQDPPTPATYNYVSDTEAIIVASASLAIVLTGLTLITLAAKRSR